MEKLDRKTYQSLVTRGAELRLAELREEERQLTTLLRGPMAFGATHKPLHQTQTPEARRRQSKRMKEVWAARKLRERAEHRHHKLTLDEPVMPEVVVRRKKEASWPSAPTAGRR